MTDARELTDSDIMAGTEYETNDQGHTKFVFKQNGKLLIESEWLNEDQRKKALQPWLNAVDGALASAKAEQRARDKRAKEERKLKETPAQEDMKPGSIIQTIGPPAKGLILSKQEGPVDRLDPHAFAVDSFRAAQENVAYWRVQSETASKNLARAQRALEQWQTIVNSLITGAQKDD